MATHQEDDDTIERAGVDGLTPAGKGGESYDATRDPRTGRPPNPLEAQRLAREREQEKSQSETATADGESETGVAIEQAPARMASPQDSENETPAVDALVEEGIAREEAERLVEAHGENLETLKAMAWTQRPASGAPEKS